MGGVRIDKIIGYDFNHNPFGEGVYCLKCIPDTLAKRAREDEFVMEWEKDFIFFCDCCRERLNKKPVEDGTND
jgi:hypothetical protein